MDLSKPDTASQPPTLPPELILVIIELLCHEDRKEFSLLSKSSRQLALPSVFRRITYSKYVANCIKKLNEASGDIKAEIKELILYDGGWGKWDYESILFPFLRSLPNLQRFRWSNYYNLSICEQGFHKLVTSLQHCPLDHFSYRGPHNPSEPATAPRLLKSLSLRFQQAHMYDLIRPSFSTLVALEIYPSSGIDLLQLKPAGKTLREFVFNMRDCDFDPNILDTIPDTFPNLTSLILVVQSTSQDLRWKSSYDDALTKHTKLQYLGVVARAFTFCDLDPTIPHVDCKKCGKQRVEATRTLAIACTELKHCWWEHSYARYCFNVRLSKKSSEGSTLVRVKSVSDRYIPKSFEYRCEWCGGPGVVSCRSHCK